MSSRKSLFRPTTLVAVAWLSAAPLAARAAYDIPNEVEGTKLSAKVGLGYDNNAFRAPSGPYTNYGVGAQPYIVPQKKPGFFVPYEVKAEAGKSLSSDRLLLGFASLDGRKFLSNALSNADSYNLKLHGGYEFIFGRRDKDTNQLYMGALLERHHRVYLYHENGLPRAASNRYDYFSTGVEANYRNTMGKVDYGVNGKLAFNTFDSPPPGITYTLDHTYIRVGADAAVPITANNKLKGGLTHWIEAYSNRSARDATGAYSAANPLLTYTYDEADLSLHNRLSADWRLYLDYSHTWRNDSWVQYNNYAQDRYGFRVLYEQGPVKARLSAHHWSRNYPHAFAFDNPIAGKKVYSGNSLALKGEWEQTKTTALWAELAYYMQNTTDLRYKYTHGIAMVGVAWKQ